MGTPKETVWQLEPHTRAKHEILVAYLKAWFPILSHGSDDGVLYIDGFAGPGRYAKGEQGSPLLALEAAKQHRLSGKVRFWFIEQDPERASHPGRLHLILRSV